MLRLVCKAWVTPLRYTRPTMTRITRSTKPTMVRGPSRFPVDLAIYYILKGTLHVHGITPPFPRAIKGKFHIIMAHARQLHLTLHLLMSDSTYDVFFVDQLSTCVPFLRTFMKKRVVFYCHFPDKLLANGAFTEDVASKRHGSLLKRIYRYPMDWLEEVTTGA